MVTLGTQCYTEVNFLYLWANIIHCMYVVLASGVADETVELELIEKKIAPVFQDVCLSGNVIIM